MPSTPIRKFEKLIDENKNKDLKEDFRSYDKPCIYNTEFLDSLKILCDRFEMKYTEDTDIMVSALIIYIDKACLEMKNDLEDFLEGKIIVQNIIDFIDNYQDWRDFGINDYLLEDDEIGYNIFQFTIQIIIICPLKVAGLLLIKFSKLESN